MGLVHCSGSIYTTPSICNGNYSDSFTLIISIAFMRTSAPLSDVISALLLYHKMHINNLSRSITIYCWHLIRILSFFGDCLAFPTWPLFRAHKKVCRYNCHSAGSLGWSFPLLKYKYIFQIEYTEAILSNGTRKLLGLWFKISKMLTQFKN